MAQTDRTSRRTDRREFFRGMLRGIALGGMALGAGALVLRGRGAEPDHTCVNRGVCRGCPRLPGCGLPQALSAREVVSARQVTNSDK